MGIQYSSDSLPEFNRPMVFVVLQGSPNPNAPGSSIISVYGDVAQAQTDCASMANAGKITCIVPCMISTPGKLEDYPTVCLHWSTGQGAITAFGSMAAAEQLRASLGGTVRSFQLESGDWAGRMNVQTAARAGNLSKWKFDKLRKQADGADMVNRKLLELAGKHSPSAATKDDFDTLAKIAIQNAWRNPKDFTLEMQK